MKDKDKANAFAKLFGNHIRADINRICLTELKHITKKRLGAKEIVESIVFKMLQGLDITKTNGPGHINKIILECVAGW